ncbi:nucleoside hydrolase, partial [Bacillus subtilis]|nr:nucleoside hydrolase [Bacillus subtilis]
MESSSSLSAKDERSTMKKIILDLDTGIDDTLAISYILG